MTIKKTLMSTMTAATLVMAAQQPAVAQGTAAKDGLGVEEIVVTARKRDESILETPIAITAVTGEDIADEGHHRRSTSSRTAPRASRSATSAGAGRSDRSFQQITLRGIVPSTTISTLTATFIDGVPVASPSAVSRSTTRPASRS